MILNEKYEQDRKILVGHSACDSVFLKLLIKEVSLNSACELNTDYGSFQINFAVFKAYLTA